MMKGGKKSREVAEGSQNLSLDLYPTALEVVLSRENEPVLPTHGERLVGIRKAPALHQKSRIRDDTEQAFVIDNVWVENTGYMLIERNAPLMLSFSRRRDRQAFPLGSGCSILMSYECGW